jgi:hypothetical protein
MSAVVVFGLVPVFGGRAISLQGPRGLEQCCYCMRWGQKDRETRSGYIGKGHVIVAGLHRLLSLLQWPLLPPLGL